MNSNLFAAFLCFSVISLSGLASLAAETKNADFEKGLDLVAKKSYQEAISSFDKALQSNPKLWDAVLERALCNLHLTNYKKTIEDCRSVCSQADASALLKRQAYMLSGGAHNALGEYNDAIDDCSKAIESDPKSSLPYSDRAFAYKQLHRFDEALRDCNEAIKLDPKHASNYGMRAAIHASLMRADLAKVRELRAARAGEESPWQAVLERLKSKTASGESKK